MIESHYADTLIIGQILEFPGGGNGYYNQVIPAGPTVTNARGRVTFSWIVEKTAVVGTQFRISVTIGQQGKCTNYVTVT